MREKCNNHRTEDSNIAGYIETNNDKTIIGWFFHYNEKKVLEKENIHFVVDDKIIDCEYGIERDDVVDFYKNDNIKKCGFKLKYDNLNLKGDKFKIEYQDNNEWKSIFTYEKPTLKININTPKLIVVDNFYGNPDEVREFALKQTFVPSGGHKGKRTTKDFNDIGIKKRFEELIGKPIVKWDYKWNGCFQYCVSEDPLVVHCDLQNYAALIFLTDNAPCSTGTSFYRHKKLGKQYFADHIFDGGNYDFTPFELVDKIGNIYNRLVIFDAKLIHAASEYFGTHSSNGRLFQIFFFDI